MSARARKFPAYESHKAAATDGCFACGANLDGNAEDTGYPPGQGQFRQGCSACDFFTSYDVCGGENETAIQRA
jgi:hypothetical protein